MTEFAVAQHPVWSEIAPEIEADEFRRPYEMDVAALRLLSAIRRKSGVPFRFTSDARDPLAGIGAKNSAHNKRPCTAVDLRVVSSRERFLIVQAALACGVRRIGIYAPNAFQKRTWGINAGSIHLDCETSLPQDVIWVDY